MAEQIDDAEFWLPSMIFLDDDTLMENKYLKNKNDGENNSESSTPVESVVGSTETESSDEEYEFIAGLTRQIVRSTSQKLAVPDLPLDENDENGGLASSPESTLTELGSSSASSNGGSRVAEIKMSKDVPKNTIFKHGKNQPKIQNMGS
ncbi:hypothetical protein F3Y22_tig00110187pilonHSYRG00100 [Hibiscus syriacus]|uniref:Uncharacterized protein n=1 Tax=Hibiscus syriacus TaxID=106335 RepID=A0A6A3BHA3_HIBSY|nr:hypothetical protein F3Y22_tig00110187pilonHSYRG00100 [Hibiscus syriacus]